MKLKWIIIGIAILAAFVVLMPSKGTLLPEELVGVWTTKHPNYTDRSFELTKVTVIFGTGRESIDVNFITNVEKRLDDNKTLYTVYSHHLEGPEDKISFYYSPKDGGAIQFEHQKQIVWKRIKRAG